MSAATELKTELIVDRERYPYLDDSFLAFCDDKLSEMRGFGKVIKNFSALCPDFVRSIIEIHSQDLEVDAFGDAISELESSITDDICLQLGYGPDHIPPLITKDTGFAVLEDGGYALIAAAHQLDQERAQAPAVIA